MHDIRETQGLIIDMDGVLWRGKTPLPGLQAFFSLLRARGLPFILATNNATATPEAIQRRLAGSGVSIQPQEVMTSALATAAYLKERLPAGAAIFVIGEDGLQQALQAAGFRLQTYADGSQAVVVGMDRQASWSKLAEAAYALQSGAQFIGTNPDPSFPTERGLAPGNGALLAALERATGLKPTIIGKPEPHLFRQALARLGTPPGHTLVVGDRLETDILGGRQAGLSTALLLTGVTRRDDLAGAPVQPDWVFEDLPSLTRALGCETP